MSPALAPAGTSPYAVLTPYLVPQELARHKVVNIGDGFILRAIERLFGRFSPALTRTSRAAPSGADLARLAEAPGILLAGANQLNDQFSVWPGLTAAEIRAGRLRIVPVGVGIHGDPARSERLSDDAKDVLRAIHERIEHSAWRCPATTRLLEREVPDLKGRFLMTGCPVVYDAPLLDGARFHEGDRTIAVTVTERGDYWERETSTLEYVARRFPRSRRVMVLHQNFRPPRRLESLWNRIAPLRTRGKRRPSDLRHFAVRRGYEIMIPSSAEEAISFYDDVDMHFGSRLHAHLLFLSRNKRSFVTQVDGRVAGIAEALGFPLCAPERFDDHLGFRFEIVRDRARASFAVMRRFVDALAVT